MRGVFGGPPAASPRRAESEVGSDRRPSLLRRGQASIRRSHSSLSASASRLFAVASTSIHNLSAPPQEGP